MWKQICGNNLKVSAPNAKKTSPSSKKKGLIIFKEGQDIVIILSGGHKKRSVTQKVFQETANFPNDNGRVLIKKLIANGIKDPQATINTLDYDVFLSKTPINSVKLNLIQHALYIFLPTRYTMDIYYADIIDAYRSQYQ